MSPIEIDIFTIIPELFLACATMMLLLLGVFGGPKRAVAIHWAGIVLLGLTAYLVYTAPVDKMLAFNGLFIRDGFGALMKMLCLTGSAFAILMSINYMRTENSLKFEYPVLICFAALGMMMMVSANDLMSLYIGIELQSLALYVLAAFNRDSYKSTEAGLKYFVLGALSSGMLLYGASLVYGFSGATNFDGIAYALNDGAGLGLIVGLMFMLAGLCFKVSATPFHMWTPDVYEGSPTPVTAFFAVAPKIAAMALFIRLLMGPFADLVVQWQQVIIFVSVASMLVGAVGAITQTNIKRLLAYSSIGHMGYALMGLSAATEDGVMSIVLYLGIYLVMSLGTFAAIIVMRKDERAVDSISDLSGLSKTHPFMALMLAIFMFSMAGIPPMAGFFGKLYVFMAVVEAGLFGLAVVGVLTSVIAAYYYIRIIKVMYFDDVKGELDAYRPPEITWILAGSGAFTSFFILFPAPFVQLAGIAAAAFFAP